MARRARGRRRWRVLGALLLVAIIGGAAGWWHLHHWRPERKLFPMQGVEIGSEDAADGQPVDWKALKAIGADFAYVDASASAFARDPAFSRNLDDARAAGLQVGAVHRYDPCQPADRQSANFVTVVPRDPKLLPPAVELVRLADDCPIKVTDAAVESELMTFLNQIETHTGKPSLLKVGPAFERRYHIAHALDRNLWLMRNRFQPEYAHRPWSVWTANDQLQTTALDSPVRWLVVQP
ncbi:MAG: glycoside hydrolase family 25 protein [Sphingomonadales bacterium]|nr:glycoside hydrolase family 25 protein [Sphingomonadales bacterium]